MAVKYTNILSKKYPKWDCARANIPSGNPADKWCWICILLTMVRLAWVCSQEQNNSVSCWCYLTVVGVGASPWEECSWRQLILGYVSQHFGVRTNTYIVGFSIVSIPIHHTWINLNCCTSNLVTLINA
jgi:hypothetical protein